MTPLEVGELVAVARGVDRREVTQLTIGAWAEVLDGITYEEARRALVAHRREEPGVWVEPGHLWQRAQDARQRANGTVGLSEDGRRAFVALGGTHAAWDAVAGDPAAEQEAIVAQRGRQIGQLRAKAEQWKEQAS